MRASFHDHLETRHRDARPHSIIPFLLIFFMLRPHQRQFEPPSLIYEQALFTVTNYASAHSGNTAVAIARYTQALVAPQ